MGLMDKKLAVVTGGAQGIGEAICRRYVEEGARVVIADLNEDLAKETAKKLGSNAYAVRLDVANKQNVVEVVDYIWNEIGPIDVWVNNAGLGEMIPLEELPEDRWDLLVDVDMKGVFLCSQAVFKKMKTNGGGKFINMASMAGERGGRNSGIHYSAAKGGVLTMTKVIALNGGEYNITANSITPGLIVTPMGASVGYGKDPKFTKDIPLGRMGEPEDVANAAVFYGSYLSDYVSGDTIKVNGGMYMG